MYVFILGILFTGVKDLLHSQLMPSVMDSGRLKSRGLWEIYSGLVLLAALLFRAHNLPTLACCLLVQTLMARFIWKRLHYDAAQTTIMHYWFGQAFFFFQVRAVHRLLEGEEEGPKCITGPDFGGIVPIVPADGRSLV